MLIVCPNCATSYMIEPASVGPAGRAVRCARCKTTWFAGGPKTAGEPGCLAARATHGTAGRTDRGRIDQVGRGAARTDNQHGICCIWVVKTYQPSVNGPETMADPGA